MFDRTSRVFKNEINVYRLTDPEVLLKKMVHLTEIEPVFSFVIKVIIVSVKCALPIDHRKLLCLFKN